MRGELTEQLSEILKINECLTIKANLHQLFESYDNVDIIGEMAANFTDQVVLERIKLCDFLKVPERKVNTIGTFFPRMYKGGTERVLSILLLTWINMGYKVVLFTDEAENGDFEYPEAVERVVLENGSEIQVNKYRKRALELKEKILKYQIDIMIYHAWMSGILLWDMLLIKSIRVPFVLYTHGVFSTIYHDRNELTQSRHEIYKLCDGIIAATEVSCRFYRAFGCKIFYIQNPIDMRLMNKKRAELQHNHILWIGRISTEKRPLDAIKIFERILQSEPTAELYVVGDGSEYFLTKMKQECKEKGISDYVHFCGFQKVVEKYYLDAAVMLMTSEFEGYCMTLLESKAYGLPCVMYELPYLSLVKDKKGIRTASIGDIDEMANQVVGILKNMDYRKKLGQEARESFERACQFDLEKAWSEVFDTMASGFVTNFEDEMEKQMIQLLVEHNNIGIQGYVQRVKETKDYRWGNKILKMPRKFKHFLSEMRGTLYDKCDSGNI